MTSSSYYSPMTTPRPAPSPRNMPLQPLSQNRRGAFGTPSPCPYDAPNKLQPPGAPPRYNHCVPSPKTYEHHSFPPYHAPSDDPYQFGYRRENLYGPKNLFEYPPSEPAYDARYNLPLPHAPPPPYSSENAYDYSFEEPEGIPPYHYRVGDDGLDSAVERPCEPDVLDRSSSVVSPSPINSNKTKQEESGELRSLDIVVGRGAPTNFHYGNQVFKELVEGYQTKYLFAKRSDKPQIALKILDLVKEQGARFVRRQKAAGHFRWEEIGDKGAYEKVCQALRDGAPDLRRQMMSAVKKNQT